MIMLRHWRLDFGYMGQYDNFGVCVAGDGVFDNQCYNV